MDVQPTIRLQSLPLAWAYACRRIESRKAADRYQRREARTLRFEAVKLYGKAIAAGGAEQQAARLAARIIRENLAINDPGFVATLVAEAQR